MFFNKNFTIFSSNAGKTENVPELGIDRLSVHVTFISQQLVPVLLNSFIYFTNCFNKANIYLEKFNNFHRHLTIQLKQSNR